MQLNQGSIYMYIEFLKYCLYKLQCDIVSFFFLCYFLLIWCNIFLVYYYTLFNIRGILSHLQDKLFTSIHEMYNWNNLRNKIV